MASHTDTESGKRRPFVQAITWRRIVVVLYLLSPLCGTVVVAIERDDALSWRSIGGVAFLYAGVLVGAPFLTWPLLFLALFGLTSALGSRPDGCRQATPTRGEVVGGVIGTLAMASYTWVAFVQGGRMFATT